jgi:(5-formylfuran-3-yl)methyl phosphate synthase
MPQLLVSVRTPQEAEIAVTAGADVVDIKDPAHGSLGRADDKAIASIVGHVAGRKPVSAAMGELAERSLLPRVDGLAFVKWGLAGYADRDWQRDLTEAARGVTGPVAVAYADWRRANAPAPDEVTAYAIKHRWPVVLFDTWRKDGATLLDWFPPCTLADLTRPLRVARLRFALAGSLSVEHIPLLADLKPDWLAVRGAVCRQRDRGAVLDGERIEQWAQALTRTRAESSAALRQVRLPRAETTHPPDPRAPLLPNSPHRANPLI